MIGLGVSLAFCVYVCDSDACASVCLCVLLLDQNVVVSLKVWEAFSRDDVSDSIWK